MSCLRGWLVLSIAIFFAVSCQSADKNEIAGAKPIPKALATEVDTLRGAIAKLRDLEDDPSVSVRYISQSDFQALEAKRAATPSQEQSYLQSATSMARDLMHVAKVPDSVVGTADVAVHFDQPTATILLVGEPASITPLVEVQFAHEYALALQAADFDLKPLAQLTADEADKDTGLTQYSQSIACLTEGDATLTALSYMKAKYGDAWEIRLPESQRDEPVQPSSAPTYPAIGTLTQDDCVSFVQFIHSLRGWQGVDQLYQSPPSTEAQILQPARYVDAEVGMDVSSPDILSRLDPGWKKISTTSFGEKDLFQYLAPGATTAFSLKVAADGWAGGLVTLYSFGDGVPSKVLVQITLQWQTENDLQNFKSQYNQLVANLKPSVRSSLQDGSWWSWDAKDQHGYVWWEWSRQRNRTDIVLTSDADALKTVAQIMDGH